MVQFEDGRRFKFSSGKKKKIDDLCSTATTLYSPSGR